MDKKYLIGLDVGTTSVKGVIIDKDGHLYATAKEEYTLETPSEDICEMDSGIYWKCTQTVIQNLLKLSKLPAKSVASLAFSSQGETLITVDKDGNPLRKAIVWLDNRSKEEARQLARSFSIEQIHKITGQPEIVPTWTATKILWLRKNEVSVFENTHKFLLLSDYLVFKLTEEYVTEESLVSSTLYFDFQKKIWWKDMLGFLGISSEQLPSVLPSGTLVGHITKTAAQQTGLKETTVVITGAYDHPAGAIGAGNIETGIVSETTGGAMAMCVTLDEPVIDSKLNLPCQCHAISNKYFLMPYGQTAGMVLRWFRDNFAEKEVEQARQGKADTYNVLTNIAANVPAGCDGLTMLPHLMGTGSPEFDSKAKGVFYGVTLNMTKGHFIRAILEAVACIVRENVDPLLKRGFPIKEIRVLGGGSKSELWNQIKADMLGLPVISLKNIEAASLGAAILAGVGCGIFKNIQEGCDKVVKTDKIFTPDPAKKEIYLKVYRQYRQLYQQNKPLWE
jgi:xylulokinase